MKKNKKANIYEEEILAIISIIFIAFVLFMSSKFVVETNEDINKMAPELSYQFPAVTIHSFLMMQIKKTDVKDLGLNTDKNYFIKDLLKINTDNSLEIAKEYRKEYLNKLDTQTNGGKKPLEYYNDFSKEKIKIDDLLPLPFQTDLDNINSNLESEIENNNYFFYFKTYNNKYIEIDFKN